MGCSEHFAVIANGLTDGAHIFDALADDAFDDSHKRIALEEERNGDRHGSGPQRATVFDSRCPFRPLGATGDCPAVAVYPVRP